MRITSFSSSHAQMGSTRTYEDFHKWLGDKPERLGIVSNLYKQYTATSLTEALMNVYTMERASLVNFSLLIHSYLSGKLMLILLKEFLSLQLKEMVRMVLRLFSISQSVTTRCMTCL